MRILLDVALMLLTLYWWVVIIMIVMSWLLTFNVINARNQFVDTVWRLVTGLTDPVLRPIRRFMPNFGGIDISPIVLFIGIYVVQRIITDYLYPLTF